MKITNNWRTYNSEYVINNFFSALYSFGITRICNITGLDFIGIPIYNVIRPRATTLSVSCGKGITHNDSIVSGVMESIETDVAENFDVSKTIVSSFSDLPINNKLPLSSLPLHPLSSFHVDTQYNWLLLNSISSNQAFFYPALSIGLRSYDYVDPLPCFRSGSNGLASGFSHDEALLSGLYELVERDSIMLWKYFTNVRRVPSSIIEHQSIPFQSSKSLLDLITATGLRVIIQDISSDIKLPVFKCLIGGSIDATISVTEGYGCHHNLEIAINRSITEAVQARTAIIAGSREDYSHRTYAASKHQFNVFCKLYESIYIDPFTSDPLESSNGSISENILDIKNRLRSIGFEQILIYRFEVPIPPFHVSRVVVPGFEDLQSDIYNPSQRMCEFHPTNLGFRSLFLKP